MTHRGEIIETAVRKSGISVSLLARRLGKSRRHIYNIFESDNVPFDVMVEIGRIINYDFSQDVKELKSIEVANIMNEQPQSFKTEAEELDYCKRELERIKSRYIRLLEKHNELLHEKLSPKKKS